MAKTFRKRAAKEPVDGELIGDVHCYDVVEGLRRLPEDSVTLACADPPYNIDVQYDNYNDKMSQQDYLSWCRAWLQELIRVMRVNGSIWIFINDDNVSELDVLAKSLGLFKRSHIIWYYSFGVLCTRKFSRSHTHILYYTLTDKVSDMLFNGDQISVPSMRLLEYKDKRAAPAKLPDDTWILNQRYLPEGFRPEEDTWSEPRICGTFKRKCVTPNQLPAAIVGRIIKAGSNPDDLVLDPFVGSGTTTAVAKKLGRRFVGFDISEKYVAAAKLRTAAAVFGEPL